MGEIAEPLDYNVSLQIGHVDIERRARVFSMSPTPSWFECVLVCVAPAKIMWFIFLAWLNKARSSTVPDCSAVDVFQVDNISQNDWTLLFGW